ncbi:MAG: 2-oxoacid:acceptor oxidoreductase family protein [Deltaproteobacteria bacterium]|nr:2-oxoacid:acceptor oxidoreductase family protein [Deltaproteobacteria bacterium]
MQELRIHGRGGQGAVLAGEILVSALVQDGKSGASFPMFGFERRGAPVTAFVRLDDSPIRERSQIYHPNCLIVMDPVQIAWPQTFAGLKSNATLILNNPDPPSDPPHPNIVKAGIIDATQIALQEIGKAALNTAMLGAFAATTGLVRIEAVLSALDMYFQGRALEQNKRCIERGYAEVKVAEW